MLVDLALLHCRIGCLRRTSARLLERTSLKKSISRCFYIIVIRVQNSLSARDSPG
jgi:hypothetical protein